MSAPPLSPVSVRAVPFSRDTVSWWRWPHLLALDSVAVALVWLGVFGKVTGSRVDRAEWWVLGAAVWLVYMADRLLDARVPPDNAPALLRERHRFTATHRKWLLPLMGAVAGAAVWAALFHLRVNVLRGGLAVSLLVALYFSVLLFSRKRSTSRVLLQPVTGVILVALVLIPRPESILTNFWIWLTAAAGIGTLFRWPAESGDDVSPPWVLPRKLAGGFLFALGTAAAPHFHPFQDWTLLPRGMPVFLFGACCAMNSLGIRLWENPSLATSENRLLLGFYPWLTGLLALAGLSEASLAEPYTAPALAACGISAAIFTGLFFLRRKAPAPLLSTLADGTLAVAGIAALLLTP